MTHGVSPFSFTHPDDKVDVATELGCEVPVVHEVAKLE